MARDNVEITSGLYYPEDDYLIPKKPRIDWGGSEAAEPTPELTYSYAGGLGFNAPQGSTDDVSLSPLPARQRSTWANSLAADMIDTYNMAIGTPGAYVGQTAKRMAEREKIRTEEDPEGKAIDENRAKVLSARAAATDDINVKKKYGAAIKMLLPRETQGLDDLTASEYFNTTDNKLKLEQLKGYNKLQQIALQNAGKTNLQEMKNASAEDIALLKTTTQMDIAQLNNDYRKAIADGNNARAIEVAQMITDRQIQLADINNTADYIREEMKQGNANYRTEYAQNAATGRTQMQQEGAMARVQAQQEGAMARVQAQQEGAMARAELQKAGALERARIMQDGATARAKLSGQGTASTAAFEAKVDLDALQKMKILNSSAGRWDTNAYDPSDPKQGYWTRWNVVAMKGADYGIASANNTKEARDYQRFEGLAKQIVQDQLRQIYGSQFTEKEGERFFKSMGLSPTMDPDVRWDLFMSAINDLRIKNGLNAIDLNNPQEASQATESSASAQQSSTEKPKQGKRVF